jgi:hypothetical protein
LSIEPGEGVLGSEQQQRHPGVHVLRQENENRGE